MQPTGTTIHVSLAISASLDVSLAIGGLLGPHPSVTFLIGIRQSSGWLYYNLEGRSAVDYCPELDSEIHIPLS